MLAGYPLAAGSPLRIHGGTSAEQWRVVQHFLACRSGHGCEACGRSFVPGEREPSIHHRRNRGMGGTSRLDVRDLTELLLLCAGSSRRLAGVLGCHGRVTVEPEWAVARGLVVPKVGVVEPGAVAVVLHSGRRVLLDPLGPWYLDPPDGPQFAAEFAA